MEAGFREKAEVCKSSGKPFCHILFVKTNFNPSSNSRVGKSSPFIEWKELKIPLLKGLIKTRREG